MSEIPEYWKNLKNDEYWIWSLGWWLYSFWFFFIAMIYFWFVQKKFPFWIFKNKGPWIIPMLVWSVFVIGDLFAIR